MADAETLHASCALVGEDAVLVRGVSGAGKSSLCRGLVAAAEASGRFARLVSDDRTLVEVHHGRLVARVVPTTAGLVETRGIGIHPMPHERAAIVRLVVDLVNGETPRFPEGMDTVVDLCGVRLPRLSGRQDRLSAETVLTRLRLIREPDQDKLVTL